MNHTIQDTIPDWFNQRMADGGPVYAETGSGGLLAEPWNAITSLLMLIPVAYWLIKVRKDSGSFKFLIYALPLMALGGIGSALFHGFRAHVAFLIMDVAPSALLTLSLAIYFWYKLLKKWYFVLILFIPMLLVRFIVFAALPDHAAINVSYAITGVTILLPIPFLLYRMKYTGAWSIGLTLLAFGLALMFREADARAALYFDIGTHFLWHVFSAIGGYFILQYLYLFRKFEMEHSNPTPIQA
jgi:hemolysin III